MSAAPGSVEGLALYHFDACPYCLRVRAVLDQLGLDLELRNVLHDEGHSRELIAANGRPTVPVLRIEEPDGSVSWLPESADIVAYLVQRFG